MLYYTHEGSNEDIYNAGSKARNDAEVILEKNNFVKLNIDTVDYSKDSKFKKIIGYKKNEIIWKKNVKKLNDGDVVVIQYPLNYNTFGLDKILKKYNKKINFIVLIHDLNSIRISPDSLSKLAFNRICRDDKKIPLRANYVISHNYRMTEVLKKFNVEESKIIDLQFFDYLSEKNDNDKNIGYGKPIIIAGNLIPEKAGFIRELHKYKKLNFNLYGNGYKNNPKDINIKYKGTFKPHELVKNLEGSFGLVWDGNSTELCDGFYGNYLIYNNPHKASLYISAGIPIIVWKQSALSKFVVDKNIGVAVNSIGELEDIIGNISEEKYNNMKKNVKKLSEKLLNGQYLTESISTIINRI